ncbi:hypothetical protein EDX97_04675 [Absicoccus porci]|uniref:Uncharacterized protein n=1 Tax=Absicoccus porci TaxID=2486576 RepID=A0A3N0I185_9FIRM|nr:hypothetical protein EDX97_04675 [Absicoccus porci]
MLKPDDKIRNAKILHTSEEEKESYIRMRYNVGRSSQMIIVRSSFHLYKCERQGFKKRNQKHLGEESADSFFYGILYR